MLTLITGTPGAGKSLMAVADFAAKVPGSTVEGTNGQAVPRRLLTNIRDLVIEHQRIDADDLLRWHEWAQPGDVIIYDEVQEVWRPRSLGMNVPPCIAALETHRHKGVDIVLLTQHPMLVDPNIRRLVNQHLHVRRLSRGVSYVYEWDHCANPGQVRTALQARVWWHPKKAYAWYKSAQLHTRTTARLPRIAYVGLLAVAGLAYMAPTAYGRITERFAAGKVAEPAKVQHGAPAAASKSPAPAASVPAAAPAQVAAAAASAVPAEVRPLGCILFGPRCECFGPDGSRMRVGRAVCEEGSHRVGYAIPGDGGVFKGAPSPDESSLPATLVPPNTDGKRAGGAAAASQSTDGVTDAGVVVRRVDEVPSRPDKQMDGGAPRPTEVEKLRARAPGVRVGFGPAPDAGVPAPGPP